MTSCYTMSAPSTPTTFSMTTLSINVLASSIYGSSSVTFIDDNQAKSTGNIN